MDNLAVHHYEGEEMLEEILGEMGIEHLFNPTYSPDLNPIELCLKKTELNGRFSNDVHRNLKLAVAEAVEQITTLDTRISYHATSYLFLLV